MNCTILSILVVTCLLVGLAITNLVSEPKRLKAKRKRNKNV